MQLQVDNTTRCCQAVANGDVDIAVVGGAIPSAWEHLVQVGAGPILTYTSSQRPTSWSRLLRALIRGRVGGIMQQPPYVVPPARFCRGGADKGSI